ncbi:MAG: hypothetical protein V3T58_06880 [Candidatus Hydrothermarchaeales archaeon]
MGEGCPYFNLSRIFPVRSDPEDKKRSFEYAKADEHLSKELDFKEVANTIDDMLRSYQQRAS